MSLSMIKVKTSKKNKSHYILHNDIYSLHKLRAKVFRFVRKCRHYQPINSINTMNQSINHSVNRLMLLINLFLILTALDDPAEKIKHGGIPNINYSSV